MARHTYILEAIASVLASLALAYGMAAFVLAEPSVWQWAPIQRFVMLLVAFMLVGPIAVLADIITTASADKR